MDWLCSDSEVILVLPNVHFFDLLSLYFCVSFDSGDRGSRGGL